MSFQVDTGDDELIAAVQAGRTDAFGELYARHVAAARRLAEAIAAGPADAEDLVAEAFTRVLATLRLGRGPAHAFRAYVLTTLRRACYDSSRRDRRLRFTGDLTAYESGEPHVDALVADVDRMLAARAFAKLPERWRLVLWQSEVEGASPAQIGVLFGLTPGAAAALAFRARERLRQIYLQEHVSTGLPANAVDPLCRWTSGRLGASVRGALRARDTARVAVHLVSCSQFRSQRLELAEVNSVRRGPLRLVAPARSVP